MILANALKEIYEKMGHENPAVRFVAGGNRYADDADYNSKEYKAKQAQLAIYFKKLRSLIQLTASERLLLVTEAMSRGVGIAPLISGLNEAEIPFDIACFSTPEDKQALEKKWGTHIALGRGGTRVYADTEQSGVTKNSNDLFAQRASLHGRTSAERHASMKSARKSAKLAGRQLASWFLDSKRIQQGTHISSVAEGRLAA